MKGKGNLTGPKFDFLIQNIGVHCATAELSDLVLYLH